MDLNHWLNRPPVHLYTYTFLFEAIRTETAEGNPDVGLLKDAVAALRNLQGIDIAELRTLQTDMGDGPTERLRWDDMVSEDVRSGLGEREEIRQA